MPGKKENNPVLRENLFFQFDPALIQQIVARVAPQRVIIAPDPIQLNYRIDIDIEELNRQSQEQYARMVGLFFNRGAPRIPLEPEAEREEEMQGAIPR